jgi:hypothetical protein
VECEVEFSDEFGEWWEKLDEEEQDSVRDSVELLRRLGVTLRFPHTSGVAASDFTEMRELRIQHQGRPYRVLYAFDPTRTAMLLIGGDKTGNNRWYEIFVPIADKIFKWHLQTVKSEEEARKNEGGAVQNTTPKKIQKR